MSTLAWILLAIPLVLIWVPALLFAADDLRILWRRRQAERRMQRRLEMGAWAYRELDLSEPKGRSRLGIDKEED